MHINFRKGVVKYVKRIRRNCFKKIRKVRCLETELKSVNQRLDGQETEFKSVNQRLDSQEKELKANQEEFKSIHEELKITQNTIQNLNDRFTVFDFEINKKIDTIFDAITVNNEKHDVFEKRIVSLNTKTFNHDIRISVLEDYNKNAKIFATN